MTGAATICTLVGFSRSVYLESTVGVWSFVGLSMLVLIWRLRFTRRSPDWVDSTWFDSLVLGGFGPFLIAFCLLFKRIPECIILLVVVWLIGRCGIKNRKPR